MSNLAMYDYAYPSRTAQELYGDDQLVSLLRRGSLWEVAAFQFRVPKAMTWGDFMSAMALPALSGDPEFDASKMTDWRLNGQPFTPDAASSMVDLGVDHKSLLEFTA